jgi:hypothetical protein
MMNTINMPPPSENVNAPSDTGWFDTWMLEREWDPSANDIIDPVLDPAEPLDTPLNAPAYPSSVADARATKIRRILLAAVVTLGLGVFGMKSMGSEGLPKPELGASTSSSGAHLLTEDLVRLLSTTPNTTSAVGTYVPSVGVVISLSVTNVSADAISQWWSTTTEPIAERFAAELPNDRILVLLRSTGTGGFARTITLPSGSIAEVASYRLTTAVSEDLNALSPNSITPSLTTTDSTAIESSSTDSALAASTPVSPIVPAINPTPSLPIASALPVAQGRPTEGLTAVAPPTAAGSATSVQIAKIPSQGAVETFDSESSNWKPLSGQWKFLDGSYQQIDNSGFDFISQYRAIPPSNFSVSVKLAAIEGDLNGGLLLFQKSPGKRAGATVVDLTSSSSYLRWGHYDVAGVYVFDGGAKTFPLIDQALGATLKVEVQGKTAVVFLNETRIGEFVPAQQSGTPGLISSQAKVRFDDFTIRSR